MEFVELKEVVLPDWGWHYDDIEETAKLTTSLLKFGQLMPLIVRELANGYEVVDGRRRLSVMRQLDLPGCWIKSLGRVTQDQALKIALTLELGPTVDYPAMAQLVRSLDDDPDFHSLPTFTPYTWERIGYFVQLTSFDWAQYSGREQANLFDDDPDPPPAPPRPAEVVETKATPPPAAKKAATPKAKQAPAVLVQSAAVPDRRALRELLSQPDLVPAVVAKTPESVLVAEASTMGVPAASESIVTIPFDVVPAGVMAPPVLERTVIEFGEDNSAPAYDPSWRPDEPPCLDGIKEIQLDTETTGLKWWAGDRPIGLSVRLPDGSKKYLPWGHNGGNLDEAVVKRWAERELRDKLIYNVNMRFDNHMVREWGVDLEAQGNRLGDVAHDAALIDEYRKELNLNALAHDYLGQHKTGETLDKARMASYHASQVSEYAKQDVHLVGELRPVLQALIAKEELEKVQALEQDVIYPVCEMEKNAAYVDGERLRHYTRECRRMVDELLFEIGREVGFSVNPDKTADLVRLFDKLGLPYPGRTEPSKSHPQGQPSFADALLGKVNNPIVQRVRRSGKLLSLLSKFLTPYSALVGDDNKLRFALHQLRGDEYGTIRGRFSMSGQDRVLGKFGANLQQVFRVNSQRQAFGYAHDDASHDDEIFMVRGLFGAAPYTRTDGTLADHLSADAQSIEYRLAAHFAEAEALILAYQADFDKLKRGDLLGKWVDFHAVVGDVIRPYKDLSRNIIKNANFCLVYGGREGTLANTLGVNRSESDAIYRVWHRMFPELSALPGKAEALARGRGYVKTILGRRARFTTSEHMQWAHAAINYVIQGSAADIMKQKLVELHKARKATGFLMRFTVHDEVDGDARDPQTAQRVREVLNHQSFNLRVPIVWEVETGATWAVAH